MSGHTSRFCASIGLVLTAAALLLAACSEAPYGRREKWRDASEHQCVRSGVVETSAYVQRARGIREKGACGMNKPYRISMVDGGNVDLSSEVVIGCSMIPTMEVWLKQSVQPRAFQMLGTVVAEVETLGTYNCRTRNNRRGAKLSEHAFGNAIDIAAFRLADGRVVSVLDDWHAGTDESAFLREVHRGACETFSTTIGPDGDRHHRDHFHLDLARHNAEGSYRYCR